MIQTDLVVCMTVLAFLFYFILLFFFYFYYSMPHYMVILHALLNLIISFTFALNNKLTVLA